MDATIPIPNSRQLTSPLGVGLATLMREPSARRQQRLLHIAYEAGFRHFDVAPSYGLGTAERALGRFLRTHRHGVSVGTKVGILARGNAGLARALQRPVRALLRQFPSLRGRATRAVGAAVHTPTNFAIEACTRSLENSLRALGTETIDLLLLHEAQPSDINGGLLDWLQAQKQRGTVLNVGVAAGASAAAAILRENGGSFDVVQVPSNVLAPSLTPFAKTPSLLRLTHGALATPLARIQLRLQRDPKWGQTLAQRAGADLTIPGALAQVLLAWAAAENRDGIVLVGTSNAAHLRSAPEALKLRDSGRLDSVGEFLRTSFSGDSC